MKSEPSGADQKGFTLIESMIAMVVLAVGLLAIAAMQDMALGRNVDANEISLVTNLASDMLDRIRFNKTNVTAYNGIDTQNPATIPLATQVMANGDYTQWSARLAASRLTSVRGLVSVAAVGPTTLSQNQVTIQVTWYGGSRTGTGMGRTRSVILSTVVAPD